MACPDSCGEEPARFGPALQEIAISHPILCRRYGFAVGDAAAAIYLGLRAQRIRIGTMDLRIASIVMSKGAILLSRNLTDFAKVPGLRVEDWLLQSQT